MEPDGEEVTFSRNSNHKPKPLYHNFQGFVDDLNAYVTYVTHTRQKGYPAYVSWSGSVKTDLITVKCHDGHNHKLLEKEYQHRRENRKLN